MSARRRTSKPPSKRGGGARARGGAGAQSRDAPRGGEQSVHVLTIERSPPDHPDAYQALGAALESAYPGVVAGVGGSDGRIVVYCSSPPSKSEERRLREIALGHDFSSRTPEQERAAREKVDAREFRRGIAALLLQNARDASDVASGAATPKQTLARMLAREQRVLKALARVVAMLEND